MTSWTLRYLCDVCIYVAGPEFHSAWCHDYAFPECAPRGEPGVCAVRGAASSGVVYDSPTLGGMSR